MTIKGKYDPVLCCACANGHSLFLCFGEIICLTASQNPLLFSYSNLQSPLM